MVQTSSNTNCHSFNAFDVSLFQLVAKKLELSKASKCILTELTVKDTYHHDLTPRPSQVAQKTSTFTLTRPLPMAGQFGLGEKDVI